MHMFFSKTDGQLLTPASEAKPEVVQLHMATGLYTYFGWFPWSDFEGEALPEETLSKLTGGQGVRAVAVEPHRPLSILNHKPSSN
jgi:hypothetical protein